MAATPQLPPAVRPKAKQEVPVALLDNTVEEVVVCQKLILILSRRPLLLMPLAIVVAVVLSTLHCAHSAKAFAPMATTPQLPVMVVTVLTAEPEAPEAPPDGTVEEVVCAQLPLLLAPLRLGGPPHALWQHRLPARHLQCRSLATDLLAHASCFRPQPRPHSWQQTLQLSLVQLVV
jgi:hypothetical protein